MHGDLPVLGDSLLHGMPILKGFRLSRPCCKFCRFLSRRSTRQIWRRERACRICPKWRS